jgi:hypothetical protein
MADPPKPGEGGSYQETIAMSPDGEPPDEVKIARAQAAEAARVEAMMKAPRVHASIPPKKPRNGFLIAAIILILLGVGAGAYFMASRPKPAPVTLPTASASAK